MTTAETSRETRTGFSLYEALFLLLIGVGGMVLLLPALASSRETARANICRRNLRRFDLAMRQYAELPNRLPGPYTWPVDLLPFLQDQSFSDKVSSSEMVFNRPRPPFFTCPSQLTNPQSKLVENAAHYELIVDRSKQKSWSETAWKFRDRELAPASRGSNEWWCVGVEISSAAAEEQLGSASGPHADFSFMESNSQGETFQVGRAE